MQFPLRADSCGCPCPLLLSPPKPKRNMVASAHAVAGWLLLAGTAAGAIAHERFMAVETGAVLSPRVYHMSPAQPLQKREGTCDAGSHPCESHSLSIS